MAKAFTWGDIVLSDIPKSKIWTDNNGKKHISVKVMLKKEPEEKEKYIREAFITAALGKDETLPQGEQAIFGNLGNWKEEPKQVSAVPNAEPAKDAENPEPCDDLPF